MSRPHLMQSRSGPETVIDGVTYLYFGGTSYLGIQSRDEVVAAGCAALEKYGLHTGTSRAGYGTSDPLLDIERRAAEFFGTEDAFYFGSGYVANHVMVGALGDADLILVDEGAHFCVREAARLGGGEVVTFKHRDPADLKRLSARGGKVLVMADAVGPSSGTLAPVAEYLAALDGLEATLLLDDAHGFGVLGPDGRGLLDALGLWENTNGGAAVGGVEIAVCGTLAKALGGFGGIVPGTREFVGRARRSSHYFDGASPQPPAITAAAARALEIVMAEPELRTRLRANTLRLRAGLRELGLSAPETETAQFGVTVGDTDQMRGIHQALKEHGILLPFVPAYSGIPREGVLRFAVTPAHTDAQIDRLLSELGSLL